MPAAGVTRPTVVADRTVLEPGSPVVWFTFPGRHHDIGRFHTTDGTFTGYYANILTPVDLDADPPVGDTPAHAAPPDPGASGRADPPDIWLTTDLFLDVFLDLDGGVHVLDRDELAEAVARGWVDGERAERAEAEAARLVEAARHGNWPPPIVDEWPLERVRRVATGT
jgi:predicted RNA-binding protein associated with RNAse of E/G family